MASKKAILAIVAACCIVATAGALALIGQPKESGINDYRPSHCISGSCVSASVFSELPAYPADFNDKWLSVYYGRVSNLSWIDEKYWKQPEFYADSFDTQWLQYYLPESKMTFVAGSGPYPGDVVITGKPGESSLVETFWHAGPVNIKYQLFGFSYDFPENMSIRIGDIKVRQNATEASGCISISVKPEWVILDTTIPPIGYNWTQKITANVSLNAKCKPGWYGLEVIQAEAPQDMREKVEFQYGVTKISSMLAGGSWQIFVHIE